MSPLTLLGLTVLSCVLAGDSRTQALGTADIDLLDRFTKDLMTCRDNVGLSIALVKVSNTKSTGRGNARRVR